MSRALVQKVSGVKALGCTRPATGGALIFIMNLHGCHVKEKDLEPQGEAETANHTTGC